LELAYAVSHYDRDRGDLPPLPVINMVAEKTPVQEQPILQSRPGLELAGITMGAGPIKALYQNDGVLNNALFGISGTNLYSSETLIGAINGTGPAKLAGFEGFVFACAGLGLWSYNGTALASVATPDSFNVLDLCVGASRLVVINKDTGKFYWSNVLSTTIDALSFATAENSPDKLRACLYIGDTLILFGTETVEFWPNSIDGADPFQPTVGRVYPVGIKDTGCATRLGSGFAWVTNHNQICLNAPEQIISLPDLEEEIEDSVSVSLWSFRLEGVEFLALRLDDATHVYNSRAGTWSEFKSYDETNFIPQCYAAGYFGSGLDGTLSRWSDTHSDFGGVLERRFRAGIVLDIPAQAIHNLTVKTNPGQTPYTTGDYADATIEIRTSKNGGFTWSNWRSRSLGVQGEYRPRVQWRSLGHFSHPGLLVDIRVVDPVPFRASGVTVNDGYGGV